MAKIRSTGVAKTAAQAAADKAAIEKSQASSKVSMYDLGSLSEDHPLRQAASAYKSLVESGIHPDEARDRIMATLPKWRTETADTTPAAEGGVEATDVTTPSLRREARTQARVAGTPAPKQTNYSRKTRLLAGQGLPSSPGSIEGSGTAAGGEHAWKHHAALESFASALGIDFDPAQLPPTEYFPAPSPEDYSEAVTTQKQLANTDFPKTPEGQAQRQEYTRAKGIVYGESTKLAGTRLASNATDVTFEKHLEKVLAGDGKARGKMEAARAEHGRILTYQSLPFPGDGVDTHIQLRTTRSGAAGRLPGTTPNRHVCQTFGCTSLPYPIREPDRPNQNQEIGDELLCDACNAGLKSGKPVSEWAHVIQGDFTFEDKGIKKTVTSTGGEGAGIRPAEEPTAPIAPGSVQDAQRRQNQISFLRALGMEPGQGQMTGAGRSAVTRPTSRLTEDAAPPPTNPGGRPREWGGPR